MSRRETVCASLGITRGSTIARIVPTALEIASKRLSPNALERFCTCATIPRMWRRSAVVGLCLFVTATAWAADPKDLLERARALYNQGQFDAAIAAADGARRLPDHADAADL